MTHIKGHYYASHRTINPTGIVPKGPVIDFMARPWPRATAGGLIAWVRATGLGVALLGLAVAGCTRQRRPAAPAAGGVWPEPAASIDPAQLVGTWTCRDLNPYPDQPEQTVVTTYEAGGAFVSELRTPARGAIGAIISNTSSST